MVFHVQKNSTRAKNRKNTLKNKKCHQNHKKYFQPRKNTFDHENILLQYIQCIDRFGRSYNSTCSTKPLLCTTSIKINLRDNSTKVLL